MGWYQGLGARLVSTSDPQTGLAQEPARVAVPAEHGRLLALGRPPTSSPSTAPIPAGLLPLPSRRRERLRLARAADRPRRRQPRAVPHGQRGVRVAGVQRVRQLLAVLRPRLGAGRNFESRARVVSFDRPYALGAGSGDFIGLEHPLVMRLEEQGFDVTYATSVDLHTNPDMLAAAHGVPLAGPRRVLVDADARRRREGARRGREPRVLRRQRRVPPDPLRGLAGRAPTVTRSATSPPPRTR